jgi:hypothetical protein
MARSKRYKGATRDGSGFVALPHILLDSPAYGALSHPARALLLEVARQYHGDDNGRMLLSLAYLAPRGWKSADVIKRAKDELLAAGFIHQTVLGQRPNKAGWYACTWMPLDKLDGYDSGAALLFERSAYLKRCVGNASALRADSKRTAAATAARRAGAILRPLDGASAPAIAPLDGAGKAPPTPLDGAIRALSTPSSAPLDGHPLEKPSPRFSGAAVPALGIQAVSAGGPPDAIASAQPVVGSLLEQLQRRIGARQ